MVFLEERIGRLIQELSGRQYPDERVIESYIQIKVENRHYQVDDIPFDQGRPFSAHDIWGGHRQMVWFDTTIEIPESFDGKCVVYEVVTGREGAWDATNPQFMLYIDGKISQGLDVNHRLAVLTEQAKAGKKTRITLSAYTGDGDDPMYLKTKIKVLDRQTEQYFFDLYVPFQVGRLLDHEDDAYMKIMTHLNESLNKLDLRLHSDQYRRSLEAAQTYLTEHFYQKCCGLTSPSVYCVGHTHIDVAWLWTLDITEDKTVRSFSTVLSLMDEFPEYIFMSSQPQLYLYIKKNAPELFEKIRQRIAEGRWEPDGSMFVEADCNLASGESLIRQILVGKNFFSREFGIDNKILWLPDVFGYSAALPQIMQKSGIPYFMTTKISWNEFNKMPYDTFEWIGIDGSKVLTHFIPTRDYQTPAQRSSSKASHFTTYNGYLNPSQVMGAWQRYQQKNLNDFVLMSFGHGDGGGGPTRDMLENQRRLAKGIPGAPRTKMSSSLDFFKKLEAETKSSKSLPEWNGELYLEYHRGTYTSMARNKKYNRRSEFAWMNAEWLGTLGDSLLGVSYPADQISQGWEVILRNQFHDILPGSSIKEVYDDSKAEYEQTLKESHLLINQQLETLAACITLDDIGDPALLYSDKDPYSKTKPIIIFNPNGFATGGPVTVSLPADWENPKLMTKDKIYPCQKLTGETGDVDDANCTWLVYVPLAPAKGYQSYYLADAGLQSDSVKAAEDQSTYVVSESQIKNSVFDLKIDEKGRFISFYDLIAQRELIPDNEQSNLLMSYEDKPHNYDAWDINHYYQEKSWPVDDIQSIKVTETGPVRWSLQIDYKYLQSTIRQTISVWRDMPQIDLHYDIDWKEEQILLKALFNADIHSSLATYDIQYGNVQRATHFNTSWDFARFEVCMHKWLDLSEDDYGLSILNDSKYGCHVHGHTIGLSLLKSATHPNPDADKERHQFTFSLLPHQGGWRKAGVVQKAYRLNNPLTALIPSVSQTAEPEYRLPSAFSYVSCDQENIIIEAVKKSESGDTFIVRLFECYNRRTICRLTFGCEIEAAYECDLMENSLQALPILTDEHSRTQVLLTVKPYEIISLKIKIEKTKLDD